MSSQYRDLIVRIVGDAKGMNKATKEAESSLAAFESRVGKVGSALAGAFAGGAILSFAKQSADAALQDERAQERLAKTLQNVTGATRDQIKAVEDYIAKTESQYAVIDDELRPAFETLVRATKDTGEAQRMLQLALDVSAGSGKGLQEVSVALVKAMGGQMRGLKDLGIQVKTTSGDTASFADVQAQLNTMFAGQAAQAADSQTGRLKALSIQYENVKENIGRALLPVMMQLAQVANTLFGWFNHLSEGNQRFLTQLVVFGGVAFGAIKAISALKVALIGLNAEFAVTPLGIIVALAGAVGMYALSTRNAGDAAKDATPGINEYNKAITDLGFKADSTQAIADAFADMARHDMKPSAKSVDVFTKAIDALGLSADDSSLLLHNLITPGVAITANLDKMSPKAQAAARAFDVMSIYIQSLPRDAEYGAKSITGVGDAAEKAAAGINTHNGKLREMIRQQQIAARESELWSKRTIAAYDKAFAYLEGLTNKDQAIKNVRDRFKEYFDLINAKGPKAAKDIAKTSDALALQNEAVLALAQGAAAAAGAVPGFEKLTEAQQKVAQSRFINEWARNVQKTVEPGSPLWVALQNIINQVFVLTGGSTSADMIASIQLPGRAKGGPVMGGSAYIVGERGPEVFVPGQSGTIIPNGAVSGNTSGGTNITVNVTAPTGTDPYAFGNAVVSALKSWVRVNGKLAGVAA